MLIIINQWLKRLVQPTPERRANALILTECMPLILPYGLGDVDG